MSLNEFDQRVHDCIKRNKLYLMFGAVFIIVVSFYGGVDEDNKKQERFFEEGIHYDDYRVRMGSHFYHLGIMVSHLANIAIMTIIGILITWVTYYGIQARIWK